MQRFTPPPESPRRPIVNARASSATGAADAVVAAALSLLGGDTQQTPGPLVELLLQHKADPHVAARSSTKNDELPPLLLAAQHGHSDVVRLLVAHKA